MRQQAQELYEGEERENSERVSARRTRLSRSSRPRPGESEEDVQARTQAAIESLNRSQETRRARMEELASQQDEYDARDPLYASVTGRVAPHVLIERNLIDSIDRYIGHRNIMTDIKECAFIGNDCIASGSDDGCLYIWDRWSGRLIWRAQCDSEVLNCIAVHPIDFDIAVSGMLLIERDHDIGIDDTVKIWSCGPTQSQFYNPNIRESWMNENQSLERNDTSSALTPVCQRYL